MRKAQVSMEFILMVIMAVLFTTVLSWTAYYYYTDYSEVRNVKRLQDLGYSLQNELVLAYNVEPGYWRVVNVPSELGGYQVNISGNANDIIIEYKGSELLFRIPPVTGAFKRGSNTIRKLDDGSVVIS